MGAPLIALCEALCQLGVALGLELKEPLGFIEASLDGGLGAAAALGDLRDRQVFDHAKREDDVELWGELIEDRVDVLEHLSGFRVVVVAELGLMFIWRAIGAPASAHDASSQLPTDCVCGDRAHPGAQRVGVAHLMNMGQELDEDLMDDVIMFGVGAEHDPDDAVNV